jgi:hypothetical protein
MDYTIVMDKESFLVNFPVYDSSSTTGALLSDLAYNTASLVAYYDRWGASGGATAITLATMTKGTWASGGFVAVDGTNMAGRYQLGIPNAALANGANGVTITLQGAANMVPVTLNISLLDLATAAEIGSEVSTTGFGATIAKYILALT